METIFSQIIKNKLPSFKIYEDDKIIAILDINPKSEGHTLIIPKKYSRNIISIEENELVYCIKMAQKIANHIIKKLNVDGYRIITNAEASSKQIIFHTHFHIIPSPTNKKINIEEVFKLIKLN